MRSRELCEVALRVLRAWTYKELPDFSDIDILLCSCLPEEADVPIDELACLVISRECKKVTHESLMERKTMRSIHDRKKAS